MQMGQDGRITDFRLVPLFALRYNKVLRTEKVKLNGKDEDYR